MICMICGGLFEQRVEDQYICFSCDDDQDHIQSIELEEEILKIWSGG